MLTARVSVKSGDNVRVNNMGAGQDELVDACYSAQPCYLLNYYADVVANSMLMAVLVLHSKAMIA